jgi:hypothetical protein
MTRSGKPWLSEKWSSKRKYTGRGSHCSGRLSVTSGKEYFDNIDVMEIENQLTNPGVEDEGRQL